MNEFLPFYRCAAKINLELNHIMDRDINLLSGGELQRFAIGTVCVQQADVYGLPYDDLAYPS
jgi:translation initiation factor RLI1